MANDKKPSQDQVLFDIVNDTTPRLIFGSRNENKIKEMRLILTRFIEPYLLDRIEKLSEYVDLSPVETGSTFAENALIKARHAYRLSNLPAFADDSGICVKALDGKPGIRSARWAGENATDQENRKLLLEQLHEYRSYTERAASFVCAIAVVIPAETLRELYRKLPRRLLELKGVRAQMHADHFEFIFRAKLDGAIAFKEKGVNGFGYDKIFLPRNFRGRTMAQLTTKEKNRISHRNYALEKASKLLRMLLISTKGVKPTITIPQIKGQQELDF